MSRRRNSAAFRLRLSACFICLTTAFLVASGQALPTASREVLLSTFALAGDVYTGLGGFGPHTGLGGRNLALTAGLDFGLFGAGTYRFAAEVRGTYPLYHGHVDGQESILGGMRLQRSFYEHPWLSRLHVYGDVLAGGGEIHYVDGGYPAAGVLYSRTPSTVYGGGGGFEIDYNYHWALVGDAQVQHWETPVTQEGTSYSKAGSAGFVYRF